MAAKRKNTDNKAVETVISVVNRKGEVTEKAGNGPLFFRGYDIRALRELGEEHPDFGLVAKYEKKFGAIV